MPSFAFLRANVACVWCSNDVGSGPYAFSWGHVSRSLPNEANTYEIGDSLNWRPCEDGIIRGWSRFDGSSFNVGDPGVENLLVLGGPMHQWGRYDTCQVCGSQFGWITISIRDGTLYGVGPALPINLVSDLATYFTVNEFGEWKMRAEWNDHPDLYTKC